MQMTFNRSDFPDDFVFGTATSAYQIEGHAAGGAGPTHWDTFAATAGNVDGDANGDVACDHLHRSAEDLDLIAGAGLDAYRFSTSWARVLPEGRGPVNEAGLDFYDRLVDGMLERGIRPALTLYHWELPAALADLGGWRNRDIAAWFADYTEIVARRLGDRIWSVAPVNEAYCVAWIGHFEGRHAPGTRDISAAARAMHHVLLAHGRSVSALRAAGVGNIGGVFNQEVSAAATEADMEAAGRHDALYNRFYLSGIFRKCYPPEIVDGLGRHLPRGWQDDFDVIGQPLDWCGVNYYSRRIISRTGGLWPGYAATTGDLPKTQMGWEIYPEGLSVFLRRIAAEYSGKLPIHITENGMAWDDAVTEGAVDDPERIRFIDRHLREVRTCIAEGVPVAGWFYWSLLDNFEWAKGYGPRFGLVHVDYATQARTPKASYHALARALAPAAR